MQMRHEIRSTLTAFVLALAVGACDDSTITAPEPPIDEGPTVLAELSSMDRIADRAASGSLRLEIEVLPGGPPWVAREVEIERDSEPEEKIEGRIRAVDPAAGTIELAFGGLVVDVAGARRFRLEGSRDVGQAGFFARVESALDAGRTPGVELRRPLPTSPQAPGDPTFVARDVRLDDEASTAELEVLVDDRHVVLGSNGAGTITVFGVEIMVDPGRGTEVWERGERGDGAFEIESFVTEADPASGRVSLVNGRDVWVVPGTRFDRGEDDHLTSLEQVVTALAAGHWVEMEAEVVVDEDASWIAVEVEFEVEDDAEEDELPGASEFEGGIASVDLGASSFTLEDGRTLTVTAATRIRIDDLNSLSEVADALAAGLGVEAEGTLIADSNAPGGQRLLEVEFDLDAPDDREFEGRLLAVDASAGTFTLSGGSVYLVTGATVYDPEGDLHSLAAAASALAAGLAIEMEGDAVSDASAPGGLSVLGLKIEIDD
jgi:hypothetical protein